MAVEVDVNHARALRAVLTRAAQFACKLEEASETSPAFAGRVRELVDDLRWELDRVSRHTVGLVYDPEAPTGYARSEGGEVIRGPFHSFGRGQPDGGAA